MSSTTDGFADEITMKMHGNLVHFKYCGSFDVRIQRSEMRPIFGMTPEVCVEFRFVARACDVQPIVNEIAKSESLRNLEIDNSSGVLFPQIGATSGSATPVDPPQFFDAEGINVPFVTGEELGIRTPEGLFAKVGPCPDCHGTRLYQPLVGPAEPCKMCGGG